MKLSRAIFLVLLGYLGQTECILNGDIVSGYDLRKFKYLVSIEASKRGYKPNPCGGGILNGRMILTAAHCFADRDLGIYDHRWIRVTAHTLKSETTAHDGSIVRAVKKIYVPTEYFHLPTDIKGSRHADIAIVRLDKSLHLTWNSHKVKALALPTENYETLGTVGVVAGYGAYANALEQSGQHHYVTDGELRKLRVEVVDAELLEKYYIKAKPIGDDRYRGFCAGDSGSPLVVKAGKDGKTPTVIGIVVRNHGFCDDVLRPGTYTRVSIFLNNFINKVLKKPGIVDNGIRVRAVRHPEACYNTN